LSHCGAFASLYAVLEASSNRAMLASVTLSLYVKRNTPPPLDRQSYLLYLQFDLLATPPQQHVPWAAAMSDTTEITQPAQLSALLSSSRLVIVFCKQLRVRHGAGTGTNIQLLSLQRSKHVEQIYRATVRCPCKPALERQQDDLYQSQRCRAGNDCSELQRHQVSPAQHRYL
jgi:hypothetical protein